VTSVLNLPVTQTAKDVSPTISFSGRSLFHAVRCFDYTLRGELFRVAPWTAVRGNQPLLLQSPHVLQMLHSLLEMLSWLPCKCCSHNNNPEPRDDRNCDIQVACCVAPLGWLPAPPTGLSIQYSDMPYLLWVISDAAFPGGKAAGA
jgi:hypothetical protein